MTNTTRTTQTDLAILNRAIKKIPSYIEDRDCVEEVCTSMRIISAALHQRKNQFPKKNINQDINQNLKPASGFDMENLSKYSVACATCYIGLIETGTKLDDEFIMEMGRELFSMLDLLEMKMYKTADVEYDMGNEDYATKISRVCEEIKIAPDKEIVKILRSDKHQAKKRQSIILLSQHQAVDLKKTRGQEKPEPYKIPKRIIQELDKVVQGQEKAKSALATALYLHMASTKNSPIGNILLVGPSGCGKTKLVSELALLSGLPMKVIDASKLSGAGWVGGDIDTLLKGFRLQCKNNKQTHAIVFVDEVDKITNSSENSKHNTSEVQEMLLSEIDGYGGSRVKILYIFAGVFNGLKKIKSNKISRSIGFTAKLPSTIVKREINEELQDEQLIESGLSAEFVGRIGKIARLHSLTENEKISLLKKEGSIIGKYKEIFKELGVELRIAPKAIEDLVHRTQNTTTGVRGLEKEIATLIEPHLLTIGTKKTINIVSDKADKIRRKK